MTFVDLGLGPTSPTPKGFYSCVSRVEIHVAVLGQYFISVDFDLSTQLTLKKKIQSKSAKRKPN